MRTNSILTAIASLSAPGIVGSEVKKAVSDQTCSLKQILYLHIPIICLWQRQMNQPILQTAQWLISPFFLFLPRQPLSSRSLSLLRFLQRPLPRSLIFLVDNYVYMFTDSLYVYLPLNMYTYLPVESEVMRNVYCTLIKGDCSDFIKIAFLSFSFPNSLHPSISFIPFFPHVCLFLSFFLFHSYFSFTIL